jgi:hypothetical protein
MRMKIKKLEILTIHQLAKVIDFNNLEIKEMRDFCKIKTLAIVV